MEESMKNRLEHLHKQLDYYYDDFYSSISTYDVFLIQNKLSPLLQTISSIAEMYYDTKRYKKASLEDLDYIYGLVRANNLLKHNKTVIEVIKEETIPTFRFPFSGPFTMGLAIIAWKDVDYVRSKEDEKGHRKNQIYSYENILIGQDISATLKKGIAFLKELQN